jgi:ElaB/YqjD/DUF883 family membrane-anchored ribosome-binding protein
MSSEGVQSKVSNGIDELQSKTTSALDDGANEVKSRVDRVVGKAKEKVRTTARQARATASTAADKAADTYQVLRGDAQRIAATVDPMVREQPYVAMVAGAVIGLLLGALLFSGGAKVIYIKPAR